MYQKVTSNEIIIANARPSFIVINVEAVKYYLSARKLLHTKWYIAVVRRTIRYCGCTAIQLIGTHFALTRLSVLPFIHDVCSSNIPPKVYADSYGCPVFLTSSESDSYY